jgi:hypothetical protein
MFFWSDAVCSSVDISISQDCIYQYTWHNIQEDPNLSIHTLLLVFFEQNCNYQTNEASFHNIEVNQQER